MKFALVSLLLTCYCSVSALPTSSVADSRLLLSAKSKPEVAASVPVKQQQCVYADASKTGRKTIVCGDPAPPTLASLLQITKPVAETGVNSLQQQQEPNQLEARTFSEKCFGNKKKQEQVAVFVQQPEYHKQEHYVPQPVQYVQQQPQIQYLQPQIQYVQPQVQLLQPQVHVIQQQPAQVHYVQAPPQVHYVKQQHYVQAPPVHYVQQQYPIKSLCQQDSYYGRSAGGYPVQLMRAVDAGQTVLMAVDDDDDDDDNVGDDDSVAAMRSSSSSDPTLAVVWSGESTPTARDALGRSSARFVPSFGSIFRPAAFRTSSEGVRYREYPGDISDDFQQQLSQQQQQIQDLSGSVKQYGNDFPGQQQQLSYGGAGFSGQLQPSSSYGGGFPYGSMQTMSRSGPADFRVSTPVGYPVRLGTIQRNAVPEFSTIQVMRSNANGGDTRRSDAVKSPFLDEQNVRRPSQPSPGMVNRPTVANPKDATEPEDSVAKTASGGNGSMNSA